MINRLLCKTNKVRNVELICEKVFIIFFITFSEINLITTAFSRYTYILGCLKMSNYLGR